MAQGQARELIRSPESDARPDFGSPNPRQALPGRRAGDNVGSMGRRGLLLLCLPLLAALGLAGCGRGVDTAPSTDSRLPGAIDPADWAPVGWTWGLIQPSKAAVPQRYGVAAAATAPRAQILLLTGYGDFVEVHYRQLGRFVGQYYVSWALDGAGQGGSGRRVAIRDLGHVDSFDDDVATIHAFTAHTIHPQPDLPLVLMADGAAAPEALRAAREGLPGVAGLILVRPTLRPPVEADARLVEWAPRLWLGFIRAPGGGGWRRDDSQSVRTEAGRRMAWQATNPDLRMGGPSLGWLSAFNDLTKTATAPGLGHVQTPVLILSAKGAGAADWSPICRALPHCTLAAIGPDSTAQEIAFVEGFVAKSAPKPHPLTALPNDDPQR